VPEDHLVYCIILYFILREPIMEAYPTCGAMAKVDFALCPQCGAARGRACPQCRRVVEKGWVGAYCGAKLA
jgi:RNA polymerase subunit RPABC4/transcription elongation factor Spt4